jgi:AAA15 family ATPase/GTPase
LLTKLQEEVKDGMSVHLTSPNNDRLVIVRKNGKLQAKKLVTYHRKEDGTEAIFDFFQESDGSQRLIDLLPVFLKLLVPNSKKVFVIDEIDRSLHPLLTRSLIEMYLSCCSEKTRSQLLLTTHEVLLMDQCLLRRDEMWVTERDNLGSTKFISFSDYNKTATGKDIRKNYLQGRFGCIPRILLSSIFPCFDEKNYEDN